MNQQNTTFKKLNQEKC